MKRLLKRLRLAFPDVAYIPGAAFYWSPAGREIFYTEDTSANALYALLHETSHAILHHANYRTDAELVRLELAAWCYAKEQLAAKFGISIDDDHIEDCMDTYRDWLYARTLCPRCGSAGLQTPTTHLYSCFNCRSLWRVGASRFCRTYRIGAQNAASLAFLSGSNPEHNDRP